MKTISTVVLVLGMSGVAFAQTAAGSASAKVKAPVPSPPTTPAKPAAAPAPPAATGTKEMPGAPPDIAAFQKQFGGNLRCTGTATGDDHASPMKVSATVKAKVDLSGWWVRQLMDAKVGEGKSLVQMHTETLFTFDTNQKKWRAMQAMNDGGMMIGVSDGVRDGKVTITYDAFGPNGQGKVRDTYDASNPKNGLKMLGELLEHDGKTWSTVYELTCKK